MHDLRVIVQIGPLCLATFWVVRQVSCQVRVLEGVYVRARFMPHGFSCIPPMLYVVDAICYTLSNPE